MSSRFQSNAESRRRPTGQRQTTIRDFSIGSPVVSEVAVAVTAPTFPATLPEPTTTTSTTTAAAVGADISESVQLANDAEQLDVVPSSSPEPTLAQELRRSPRKTTQHSSTSTVLSPFRSPRKERIDPPASTASATPEPTPVEEQTASQPKPKRRKVSEDAGKLKLPVQKFGQETRIVNEVDTILSCIVNVIHDYRQKLSDKNERVPELDGFEREIEIQLTAQNELVDEHRLMQAALRKTLSKQKQVRKELLIAQKQKMENQATLQQLRAQHQEDEQTRKKTEDAHDFLTKLSALKDRINDSQPSAFTTDQPPTTENFAAMVASARSNIRNIDVVRSVNELLKTVSAVIDKTKNT